MTRLAVTPTRHASARAVLLLLVMSVIAAAQDPTPRIDLPTHARSTGAKNKAGWVPIPVLGAGPTFGFGAGGVGNAAGDADRSVIVRQNGGASALEALHRIIGPLYLGARYRIDGGSFGPNHLDRVNPFAVLMRGDSRATTVALGVAGEYDSHVSPRHGTFARGSVMYAREWVGRDRTINSYDALINQYAPVKQHTVLAFRGSVCGAGNQSPVWQLCTFGLSKDNVPVSGRGGVRDVVSRSNRLNLGVDNAFATRGGANYFRMREPF